MGACLCVKYCVHVVCMCVNYLQGFMQDHIIASHTCFDGHMDVNC